MTPAPEKAERVRILVWECGFAAVMLIGGLLLTGLGGFADVVGLLLLFFGISALGLAVLSGLGLAKIPEADNRRAKRGDGDDPRG
jgi:hypothetical protein